MSQATPNDPERSAVKLCIFRTRGGDLRGLFKNRTTRQATGAVTHRIWWRTGTPKHSLPKPGGYIIMFVRMAAEGLRNRYLVSKWLYKTTTD